MNKLDRIFWWLNEHEWARLLIALSVAPVLELCTIKAFGWTGMVIAVVYMMAICMFVIVWSNWVDYQRSGIESAED